MRKDSQEVGGDHDGWADEEKPLEGRGGWHGWEERGEGAHVDGQRRTRTGSSRVDRTEQPLSSSGQSEAASHVPTAFSVPLHTCPLPLPSRVPSREGVVALCLYPPCFRREPSSTMVSTSDSLSSPELHGSLVLCSIQPAQMRPPSPSTTSFTPCLRLQRLNHSRLSRLPPRSPNTLSRSMQILRTASRSPTTLRMFLALTLRSLSTTLSSKSCVRASRSAPSPTAHGKLNLPPWCACP